MSTGISTAGRYNRQRQQALKHANEVRSRRAEEHRAIRALPWREARARVIELIADPPEWMKGVPVHIVLLWLPRLGTSKMRQLLGCVGRDLGGSFTGYQPLGDLTARQRRVLANALGRRS